jgi:hypothetical protein
MTPSAAERWRLAAAALVVLGGVVVLFQWDPAQASVYPPCPFHALTGLHCPGCGTLRALHQLLHGNAIGALGLNPLAVLCLPLIACWCLATAVRTVTGRRTRVVFVRAFWIWAFLGVVLLFWVLRNIPVYPFSVLAP